MDISRPFLIVPKLIIQPTWGGTYITESKGWASAGCFDDLKIGQTYELFSRSKLLLNTYSTEDTSFGPEIGNPNNSELTSDNPYAYKGNEHITLDDLVTDYKEKVIGSSVWSSYKKMPLLIKLNQSLGNSFQLHIKPGVQSNKWKPKPESWYFFEKGAVTYGLKPGTNLNAYKQTCVEIANFMQQLSQSVISGQIDILQARNEAKKFISLHNPLSYVNSVVVPENSIVDLSSGGIHHSWEESNEASEHGNIVYEVQHDVMDPECTIRSFDQGKIKADGTIRRIHIEDYFNYIDADPVVNDPAYAFREPQGEVLLKTPYYALDKIELKGTREYGVGDSFVHLYIKQGSIQLSNNNTEITVGQGHSAFIPHAAGRYTISTDSSATILKTYIESK